MIILFNKKIAYFLLIGLLLTILSVNIHFSQAVSPPPIQWSKTYGGSGNEVARSIIQTNDGGYAIAGDQLLVKTDAYGNVEWSKTYGGTDMGSIVSVVQTSDNGYAIGGSSIQKAHGYLPTLIKVDAYGNVEWNETFGETTVIQRPGETYYQTPAFMIQTNDGGYVLVGKTTMTGSNMNYLLIKTDAYGKQIWNRTYKGYSDDRVSSVIQTNDNGFAIAGITGSYVMYGLNFLLIKTDADGDQVWRKTFGGGGTTGFMIQTNDGGFVLAGSGLMTKTDVYGNQEWNKTYSNSYSNYVYSLIQTKDNGYALAGYTYTESGGQDFLLTKTDVYGNQEWNKTFGGPNSDMAYCVIETKDNSYALAGSTNSFGAGGYDFYVIKLPTISSIRTVNDYDNLWHTNSFMITLTNNDTANTEDIYYKINGESTKTVSVEGQPIITTEAANNILEYWSVNKSGAEEYAHKLLNQIKLDKTAPTGSIIINDDNVSTSSTSVTLNLTYMDDVSGVSQIRCSKDGVWDTEQWQNVTVTEGDNFWDTEEWWENPHAYWNLTAGDETKTVYYQIIDNAGLISQTYFDTIDLRMKDKPSSLTLVLNSKIYPLGSKVTLNGKLMSNMLPIVNASIILSYSVTDGQTWVDVARVKTANDGTYSSIWQPSAVSTYLVRAMYTPYFTYADTEVSAEITVDNLLTLTTVQSYGGRLYPSPDTYTLSNEEATWLIAHPNPSYKFNYFLIDGIVAPAQYLEEDGDYTYYLTMNTNHVVQAVFTVGQPVFPTLTVLNSIGGQTYPYPNTYYVPELEDATWLFAHPDQGYKFSHFLIDGIQIGPQYLEEDGDYTYYLIMNTSHTVQAVFTTGNPVFPTLTVLDSPGGQIYPFPGTYLSSVVGRSTWLFAHPDPGYKFNYFLIDGNIRPAQLYEDGEYKSSLSLSADHTVQAIFTPS